MNNLEQSLQGFQLSLPTDENGLIGRECPNPRCLGYFKIKIDTGLKGDNLPCHCPYCGHTAPQDQFFTQAQVNYLQSVAFKTITNALGQDIAAWDRRLRQQTRGGFIQMRVDFKTNPHPIRYYQEKALETRVTCSVCTLEYAVYGVFAFCPDCAVHNSLQILEKNLRLALKQLDLADQEEDTDFAAFLIANTLEDAVSSFDGFGREVCRAHASQATTPQLAENVSFQNLDRANQRLQQLFKIDLAQAITTEDWNLTTRNFQKRHLLAHKMGIIDQQYLNATNDPTAKLGHRIAINPDEIRELVNHLSLIGSYLLGQLQLESSNRPNEE